MQLGSSGDSRRPNNASTSTNANEALQLSTASLETNPLSRVGKRQLVASSTTTTIEAAGPATRSLSFDATMEASTPASLPSISTTATLSAGEVTSAVATGNPSNTGTDSTGEGTLIGAGPYTCTTSIDLHLFMDVLADYLSNTETNLNATVHYLIMNLHAAAPADNPTSPAYAPAAGSLPSGPNILSSIIEGNNSAFLYTPRELLEQRADLNARDSWFNIATNLRPNSAYFTLNETAEVVSTPDGWPSEGFIELAQAKRLLASYGNVDPQMQGYNFSADAAQIFDRDYLTSSQDSEIELSSDGGISDGCFFQPSTYALSAVNNSWAQYSPSSDSSLFLDGVANITNCGITPLLNETLQNVTANQNFRPYAAYVTDTLWPWAEGQPGPPKDEDSDDNLDNRCAALNATSGRWQASDCEVAHYGACRVNDSPYQWAISSAQGIYQKVDAACNDNKSFDAPRTALENTYLVATWRDYLSSHPDPNANTNTNQNGAGSSSTSVKELLWLDANDLDAATCWVVGQNTTCPYLPTTVSETRQVVVPTVAAVIVFGVALMTIFVKCAANRQNVRRKRRRGTEGWEYEGVPS